MKVEHDGIDIKKIKEEIKDGLIIDKILQEGDGFAYLKVKTPGPIQQLISMEDEAWIMPPTYLSKEDGFFYDDSRDLCWNEKAQRQIRSPYSRKTSNETLHANGR